MRQGDLTDGQGRQGAGAWLSCSVPFFAVLFFLVIRVRFVLTHLEPQGFEVQ